MKEQRTHRASQQIFYATNCFPFQNTENTEKNAKEQQAQGVGLKETAAQVMAYLRSGLLANNGLHKGVLARCNSVLRN
jgi:hypothetical protein